MILWGISVVTTIVASLCDGSVMAIMTVAMNPMSATAVLVIVQKVSIVVTTSAAFLTVGFVTTITTVKTIQMNGTVN